MKVFGLRHAFALALPLLAAALLAVSPLVAQTFRAGDIEITQPWSRATPQGAKVGAGYLQLINKGASADRLVSAKAPIAARVELHEMTVRDGVMTMRPLRDGIVIQPGQTVTFAPGGLHMMFMELARPLKQGEDFPTTLMFEKGGAIDVTFKVQSIGAREPGSPRHHGH